jgi:hypothetical protein
MKPFSSQLSIFGNSLLMNLFGIKTQDCLLFSKINVYCRRHFLIFLFFLAMCNGSLNSQILFQCDTGDPDDLGLSSFNTNTLNCDFSGISEAEDYASIAEYTVFVNFHFIDDPQGNNFHADPNGNPDFFAPDIVEDFLSFSNNYWANPEINELSVNPGQVHDSRIRFELYSEEGNPDDPLGGIFFHPRTTVFNNNQFLRYVPLAQTEYGARVMNITIVDPDTDPGTVTGSTNFTSIYLGYIHQFYFNNDIAPWSWGRNLNHELGHIFNLPHSFSCHNNCSDMDNTMACGTPSGCTNSNVDGDPCVVPPPTPCNPTWGGGLDCCFCTWGNGNNVMGYNGDQRALTPCQWQTMFDRILSRDPFWDWGTFCDKEEAPLFITSGQEVVWDKIKLLNRDVIVEGGAKLEIRCSVMMGEGKRIIVEPNAELVLKSHITALCDTWQGIEVWGGSGSQYTVGGVRNQGKFIASSGSVVENAQTAVRLYGPTVNEAGGQISCNGTTFRNNAQGIVFAPYQNYWPYSVPTAWQGQPRSYFASFSDCTFITDDNYNLSQSFDAFVEMTAVNGVRFYGCDFNNSQTQMVANSIEDYGWGIRASESGFRVDARCTGSTYPCISYDRGSFQGLGYAVQVTNANEIRPYIIKQTDFSECYFGLYNSGVSNATILHNSFSLGQVPSSAVSNDQIGAMLEMGLAGFTFQENDFIGMPGNALNTAGIICRDLDEFNNEIRRNTFSGIDIGNLAEGDNASSPVATEERGLTYLCNENNGVADDFAVANVFGTNRIRPSQGLAEDAGGQITYRASGNQFSYIGTDFDNQGEQIKYYYYENGVNETPISIVGDILPEIASENTCPSTYCVPPCKTLEEVDISKEKYYEESAKREMALIEKEAALLNNNMELAETKEEEAGYYRLQMDKEAYMVVLHLVYDTVQFNVDTLATWVENLDLFSMNVIWALQQQSEGNNSQAEATLQRISKRGNLSPQDLKDLLDMPVLMEALRGKAPHEVSPRHFKGLESLTTDPQSFTGNIAKNILRQHGYYFAPIYHFPKRQGDTVNKDLGHSANTERSVLSVYPNPNTGQFSVHWQPIVEPAAEQAKLQIRDLSGRLVFEQAVSPNETHIINLEQAGVYFYELHIPDQVPLTGKLIVQ